MRIDVWSDVVCPWCYIGKRRLEHAVEALEADGTLPAGATEVVYHSFQLDPGAPTQPTETVADMLGRRYGGGADGAREMMARVESIAAEEGLTFRQGEAMHANTADAHRLLHLALAEGGPARQRPCRAGPPAFPHHPPARRTRRAHPLRKDTP